MNNKALEELIKVEESIACDYLKLIDLELHGLASTQMYTRVLQDIKKITTKEMQALIATKEKLSYEKIRTLIMPKITRPETPKIVLKELQSAVYYRILKLLDLISETEETLNDSLNYAETLRDDINKIISIFLEVIISDPHYQTEKETLIYYKYSNIYLNANSEYDLLIDYNPHHLKLESFKYKTSDFMEYHYIDNSVLVLESFLGLDYLMTNAYHTTSDIIIHIIEILSRLTLCDEQSLSLINDKLIYILNSDFLPKRIRYLINEMLAKLYSIKNNISRTRYEKGR